MRNFCRYNWLGHDATDQLSVDRLKISIVSTLIGEIERLMRSDRLGKTGKASRSLDVAAQRRQARLIIQAPFRDLRLPHVQDRQLRHAQAKSGLDVRRIDR